MPRASNTVSLPASKSAYWRARGICAAPAVTSNRPPDGLLTQFTFGKYKGCTVLEAIRRDAQYVWWAHTTVEHFSLDCEAEMLLDYHYSMQEQRRKAQSLLERKAEEGIEG